jgi:hypothetical protein
MNYSDQVISDFKSYQIGLGRVLDHLVSDHFGFWVVSSRVGSSIGSSSVRSFQISCHIKSGQVEYWV